MRLVISLLVAAVGLVACSSSDPVAPAAPETTNPVPAVSPPAPVTSSTSAVPHLPPSSSATDPTSTVASSDPETAAESSRGAIAGLTMFRGDPQRTFYGTGPVPQAPEVLWTYPQDPMCGTSRVGGEDKVWCGTGWTGQPVVWERPDGVTEVIFGAFDKKVHFLDAATGTPTRPDFVVGDIVKGSVTLDPDGYPLLYVGSRVNRYMIVALDRETPTEIWSLPANSVPGRWNNDWDSSAAIVDGYLLEGGENSYWFAVELNRGYDDEGLVTVSPRVAAALPAWTDDLLAAVGNQQSIESSTAVFARTAYVGTGAGRVMGIDLDALGTGDEIIFDFWAGDDIDATIVVDGEGMLYVAPQVDLRTRRAAELGQLIKLDPGRADPVVWTLDIPDEGAAAGGAWATPALGRGVLYLPTNPGSLLAVDTETGDVVWSDDIGFHAWSSPLIVDDTLIVAVNCDSAPALRAYGLDNPRQPDQMWELPVAIGCLESTPAMWAGRIYVGARDGFFYAVGDP